MAAKDDNVPVNNTWTRLTDAAGTTGITSVALKDNVEIEFYASDSGTAPSEATEGRFTLDFKGAGWNNVTLAQLFPGAGSGAPTHLYARTVNVSTTANPKVAISHAA